MSSRLGLTSILAAIGLLSPIVLFASFPNGLASSSVDPSKDSVAIAAMRQKMDEIRKERPTVALVISGGGAKGASHLGVMKYLEQLQIPVDIITGTSMGGLIGGLYSVGYSASEIDDIISSLDWGKILSDRRETYRTKRPLLTSAQKDGYLYGDNVYSLIASLMVGYEDNLQFKDLPIPFFCVANDMVTMKSVNWSEGNVLDAMRSTMSLPLIFRPLRDGDMVMLDGGMKNNLPVDLARAMGADIVIAVDVCDHITADDTKNVVSIVSESTLSSGLDALRENVENADIYIRPDTKPYSYLSFNAKDIDTLVMRGYIAALQHRSSLDSVARLTGLCPRILDAPGALNFIKDSLEIASISLKGISSDEADYLISHLNLKEGGKYRMADVEEAMDILYSTGAFNAIKYRLRGKAEPFDLEFSCEKADPLKFEFGLRIDTEEAVSLMANLKLWSDKLSGSKLDINAKASLCPSLEAIYRYRIADGPALGASSKIHYTKIPGERYWHNDNSIFVENLLFSKVSWKAGARFQPAPSTFSAFAEGLYDTCNDRYFPTKGLKAAGRYEYGAGSHFATIGVSGAISFSKLFALLPALSTRAIFGSDGNLPWYMRNYVGGAMAGRYLDQQVAMLSCTYMREASPMMALASLDCRFNIFKNFYLDGIAEALFEAQSFSKYDGTVFGAAIRASYSSPIGPLSTNIHWNSGTHTIGAYLTIGFDF